MILFHPSKIFVVGGKLPWFLMMLWKVTLPPRHPAEGNTQHGEACGGSHGYRLWLQSWSHREWEIITTVSSVSPRPPPQPSTDTIKSWQKADIEHHLRHYSVAWKDLVWNATLILHIQGCMHRVIVTMQRCGHERMMGQEYTKREQLHWKDERIGCVSPIFQNFLWCGVTLSYNKQGKNVNKLKAKINEHLSWIVYTWHNSQGSALSFHFLIPETDNEIFKCQDTQKHPRILLKEE